MLRSAPPALPLSDAILNFLDGVLGEALTIVPLAGDASQRRYFRLVAGEKSWVLMVWEPFPDVDRYPFLSVQRLFIRHHIQVPKVLAVSSELGVLVLEDLGDLTLERKFWEQQDPKMALPFYQMAIDELVKIHYLATADQDKSSVAFSIAFDQDKLLWEMNYGREHVLHRLSDCQLTTAQEKDLDQAFAQVCSVLANEPRYLCHRDYHSRNLMLQLDKMRVIDFQDARLGPIQYDLVSLLHDSYVDLDQASIDILLRDYLEKSRPLNPHLQDLEHFHHVFRYQLIQRCFKACGSFASFYNLREDRRYLKYIRHTMRKVIDTLSGMPGLEGFRKILVENRLGERDFVTEATK